MERVPGTHWTGSWVGGTAGLDAVAEEKLQQSQRQKFWDSTKFACPYEVYCYVNCSSF
jgi:hypothetical protein